MPCVGVAAIALDMGQFHGPLCWRYRGGKGLPVRWGATVAVSRP